ncbi:3-hydroxylacyl-ACP dehydratase [Candidatus Colwellia aromaticivorans]|uniref:ApeP family dehydratase n=1 Tax=Candidatus Colwellia aromaticivorans TaxID=2267621 RepID=UPI000DF3A171|nr:3-hydroxylacyl-ACP dehydratase [Candidatus Colwellia aromaticivorans]
MNKYPINELISHREPMILIGGLDDFNNESATCWLDIDEHSAFYQTDKSGVPAYIGIEYMAQSIAAFAGAKALEQGKPVQIGFLLGSRKYQQTQNYFKNGSHLKVKIVELHKESSGLGVYSCEILNQECMIASAQVNVFLPPEPQDFVGMSEKQ